MGQPIPWGNQFLGATNSLNGRASERQELGLPAHKRRRGHAQRGTAKWLQVMEAARQQALSYVRALPASEPRPPFVLVADVGYCLDVYSNFAGVGDNYAPFPDVQHFRLRLPDLADEAVRERLRQLFLDPQQLDPARLAAQVTRKLAGQLAALSTQLEAAGHPSDVVAAFLMRCLFTMFAEDAELIPKGSFLGLLAGYDSDGQRHKLPMVLEDLWRAMDKGEFAASIREKVRRFNGRLFKAATALPLSEISARRISTLPVRCFSCTGRMSHLGSFSAEASTDWYVPWLLACQCKGTKNGVLTVHPSVLTLFLFALAMSLFRDVYPAKKASYNRMFD